MRAFRLLILLFVMRKTAFYIETSYLISFFPRFSCFAFLTLAISFLDFQTAEFIFALEKKNCAIFCVHVCNALWKIRFIFFAFSNHKFSYNVSLWRIHIIIYSRWNFIHLSTFRRRCREKRERTRNRKKIEWNEWRAATLPISVSWQTKRHP